MKLQIQLNEFSCLITSFAMVMDCTVDSLIEEIGHDGSEIVFPGTEVPWRTWHPQEFIELGLRLDPRRFIIHIDPDPQYSGTETFENVRNLYTDTESDALIFYCLDKYDCVFTGTTRLGKQRHAVAWSHKDQLIYDPKGTTYFLENFKIEDLFIVITEQLTIPITNNTNQIKVE